MYENLINQYPVQKTLRFELIPQGKTLDYIQSRGIISEDEERAEQYKKLKKVIDDYHRDYIEKVLKSIKLEGLEEYYSLYVNNSRSQDDLDKMAEKLRKQVVSWLKGDNDKDIKRTFDRMFKEELIKEDLFAFIGKDDEKKEIIQSFNRFTTYLTGFHENRKNMYTAEAQTTAIAFRLINQNLPKYIDNYLVLMDALQEKEICRALEGIKSEMPDILLEDTLEEALSIRNYSAFMTQSGIDRYNTLIGGKALEGGEKLKGINEYINLLHDQKSGQKDKIGTLKPLYKQILSDKTSYSFIDEAFKPGKQGSQYVLNAIRNIHSDIEPAIIRMTSLLQGLNDYQADGIFVANDGAIEEISKAVYDDWSFIRNRIQKQYDLGNAGKKIKDYEKYVEKRDKELAKKRSYSLAELRFICEDNQAIEYFTGDRLQAMAQAVFTSHEIIEPLLKTEYPSEKNLAYDKSNVELLKD